MIYRRKSYPYPLLPIPYPLLSAHVPPSAHHDLPRGLVLLAGHGDSLYRRDGQGGEPAVVARRDDDGIVALSLAGAFCFA